MTDVDHPVDDERTELERDEEFANSLILFLETVQSVCKSPKGLYSDYGNFPNTGWEVINDLLYGEWILPWNRLSEDSKARMRNLFAVVKVMPISSYTPVGLLCLFDPSWERVRVAAKECLGIKPAT